MTSDDDKKGKLVANLFGAFGIIIVNVVFILILFFSEESMKTIFAWYLIVNLITALLAGAIAGLALAILE